MARQQDWMSIDQAAEYLGVGRRTIHKYIQQGKLPGYKTPVGGRTLLMRSDVEAFKVPRPMRSAGTESIDVTSAVEAPTGAGLPGGNDLA